MKKRAYKKYRKKLIDPKRYYCRSFSKSEKELMKKATINGWRRIIAWTWLDTIIIGIKNARQDINAEMDRMIFESMGVE